VLLRPFNILPPLLVANFRPLVPFQVSRFGRFLGNRSLRGLKWACRQGMGTMVSSLISSNARDSLRTWSLCPSAVAPRAFKNDYRLNVFIRFDSHECLSAHSPHIIVRTASPVSQHYGRRCMLQHVAVGVPEDPTATCEDNSVLIETRSIETLPLDASESCSSVPLCALLQWCSICEVHLNESAID
jgi:hypothetical protein